ncbi:MAG: CheR family methyltransferase [Pseudomonadota bacterium]
MVQTPDSTEYDGMPRNAIATGLVDYVLKPAEMPAQLIAYAAHIFGQSSSLSYIPAGKAANALKKIFILLRAGTGHDFSQYKKSTIIRRIERRMAVHQIEMIDNYVQYLQLTPTEVEELFRDLLIGVTNFFRDPEAFQALEEQVIPKLFAGKPAGSAIRVWSPGCSTGEEAYSLAILLQERFEALKQGHTVQIFATDIDSRAIATARTGIYPASIATDISPKRFARFFTAEPDGSVYRIQKSLRDMLVFSEHNVIKDPPFSKLDLISCRNLLIYIGGDLQRKIMSLFHYALNSGGVLFLGSSETIGDSERLFTTLDRKSKFYQRNDDLQGYRREPLGTLLTPMTGLNAARPQVSPDIKTTSPGKVPLRNLTEQTILQQVAPVAVLVDKKGDIVYLHGRTGMYLEMPPGETETNILKMAREGLGHALTIALQKSSVSNKIVRYSGLRVKTNGDFTGVNLTVHPVSPSSVTTVGVPLYLVVFEESALFGQDLLTAVLQGKEGSEPSDISPETATEANIQKLRQELQIKEEYLQNAIEELDTSNEELKSSNEEMQSVNEEMQSTNEELETSKEELQSVNEELATVNSELQINVVDLSRANNDMNNLLAGTGIATVFVDLQQRILRFTPSASRIINLIASDLGRPVGHIVSNLRGYNRLVEDVQTVLDTLVRQEIDVQTGEDAWYRMRIQPYRTLKNVIEGAVITFTDITEVKKTQEALAKAHTLSRHAVVVRDTHDCMIMQNLEGAVLAWNPAAERLYGWSEAEALTMKVRDLIPEEHRKEALAKLYRLSKAEILEPYSTQRICKNGTILKVTMISTALVNEVGYMYAIATTERVEGLKSENEEV